VKGLRGEGAEVQNVELRIGRLSQAQQCFVQVVLLTVISDLFSGNERWFFGRRDVGNFSSLASSRSMLEEGSSVLFGSPSFTAATGLVPDVEISDADCSDVDGDVEVELKGSFGAYRTSDPAFELWGW
jgi:hypothetical protein